jgi:hypothetical protein
MILQVLADARRACLPSAALSPTPDSINNCSAWNAPETITSRPRRLLQLLALAVFDADARLPSAGSGRLRLGFDRRLGARPICGGWT